MHRHESIEVVRVFGHAGCLERGGEEEVGMAATEVVFYRDEDGFLLRDAELVEQGAVAGGVDGGTAGVSDSGFAEEVLRERGRGRGRAESQ